MSITITTPKYLKLLKDHLILLFIFSICITSCSHFDPSINSHNEAISQNSIYPTDSTITLEQVTQDVSYLASDTLQGRDNFSSNIHTAANFIAKRFNDVGLIPLPKEAGYKQQYSLQKITPHKIDVEINGEVITDANIAMVSTVANFQWRSSTLSQSQTQTQTDYASHPINTVFVGKDINLRKTVQRLNKMGGEHLVLLHPKHKNSFKRYQEYFAKGITRLAENNKKTNHNLGGVIVLALTNMEQIEHYSVSGSTTIRSYNLSNIVGILPGKSKANEIVLYSAHYDHLGIKADTGADISKTDHIFNGADDDASGVAAIISLANHFVKNNANERTLMFAAFSAEELGGFGSQYFSQQLNPDNITAMINIEMIGKPAVFGDGAVWMTGMDRSNLGEQLNKALTGSNLKVFADPYPKEKLFYRSDNATLARLGVPAHSFSSTQLDKDKHYHQVSDEVHSLNLPSMIQVIKTLAIATTPLAMGIVTPSRIEPNKIKPSGVIY